jgi:hypothetical protein
VLVLLDGLGKGKSFISYCPYKRKANEKPTAQGLRAFCRSDKAVKKGL